MVVAVLMWWLLVLVSVGSPLDIDPKDGGYSGILVAIGEDVPEDHTIIHNIKRMFQEGSGVLQEATRRRRPLHFKQVSIVVPPTWSSSLNYSDTNGLGWIRQADVKVDLPHPQHGPAPYTLQPDTCGHPGQYIHLAHHYVANMFSKELIDMYGPPGKVLVHEWAHLRWGVYDEYGSAGSSLSPAFYASEHPHQQAQFQVQSTTCSAEVKGWLLTAEGTTCCADHSGLPDQHCHFYPATNQTTSASLMGPHFLPSVTEFCDNDTHSADAPTPHNLQCGGRSVWEVLSQHPDFAESTPRAAVEVKQQEPRWDVMQERAYVGVVLHLGGEVKLPRPGGRPTLLSTALTRYLEHLVTRKATRLTVLSVSSKQTNRLLATSALEPAEDLMKRIIASNSNFGRTRTREGPLEELRVQFREQRQMSVTQDQMRVVLVTAGGGDDHLPYLFPAANVTKLSFSVVYVGDRGPTTGFLQNLTEVGVPLLRASLSPDSVCQLHRVLLHVTTPQGGSYSLGEVQVTEETHRLQEGKQANGQVILDSTIGPNTNFRFRQISGAGRFSLVVNLQDPDGVVFDATSAACVYAQHGNQAHFRFPHAQAGTWTYSLKAKHGSNIEVEVVVTSQPDPDEARGKGGPISVKMSPMKNVTYPDYMPLYAHVSRGYGEVLGAQVVAMIARAPSPNHPPDTITIPLLDNGIGADRLARDGVYSAYFTQYSADGRYSLSVNVTTSNQTTIQLSSRQQADHNSYPSSSVHSNAMDRREVPVDPNTLPTPYSYFPAQDLEPQQDRETHRGRQPAAEAEEVSSEAFTRFISGKVFEVAGFEEGQKDRLPPGPVTNLAVTAVDLFSCSVTLTWSSSGDDFYEGTASKLEVSFYENYKINSDFDVGQPVKPDHLLAGDLQPKPAPHTHVLSIKLEGHTTEHLEGRAKYFAVRVSDEVGNQAVSNVATAYFPYKKFLLERKKRQREQALSGLVVLVTLAVICVLILVFVFTLKVCHTRRRKRIQGEVNPVMEWSRMKEEP